jgi:hypothetical protein
MRVKTTIKILLFLSAAISNISVAEEQSLREKFIEFRESIFSRDMEFGCGRDNYRLEKGTFGGAKIFWKNGLQWLKLENLKIYDNGIKFDGLGFNEDIQISDLNFNPEIPLIDTYKELGKYVSIIKDKSFHPMSYEIDFYERELTKTNSRPATTRFNFDIEQYVKDKNDLLEASKLRLKKAKTQLANDSGMFKVFTEYDKKTIAEESQNVIDLENAIQKAIKKSKDPIVLVSPGKSISLTEWCRQVN